LKPVAPDPASIAEESTREGAPNPQVVTAVRPGSPAARAGIEPGSRVTSLRAVPPRGPLDPRTPADDASQMAVRAVVDGRPMIWQPDELPRRALPVYPAQVISSLSGLAICALLLLVSWRTNLRTGALTAIGFAAYAVARFGEEAIRTDEPGQFGTGLSISQWVSLLVFPAALGLIFYIYRVRPTPRVGAFASESGTGSPP
jgi:phosphatidylglycerol:prolipoprotein diacylglycerol transferase